MNNSNTSNAEKICFDTEVPNENVLTKRIGNTTYIVTSRFNGNDKFNPLISLLRLVERECINI